MAALSHPFSIYDALEVEGVVVGERAEVYRLPVGDTTVQVAALPHFSRHQVAANLGRELSADALNQAVHDTVKRLEAAVDPSLPSVFAGHCHVNQADLSDAQNLFGASELEVTLSSLGTTFPYYALGHVHRRQVLSRSPFIAYSGSLERVDFGEGETLRVLDGSVRRTPAEAKGFYRFDLVRDAGAWTLAGEPSFREVGARPFVTVRLVSPPGADPNESVEDALRRATAAGTSFGDAFVKIVVGLDAVDRSRVHHRRLREALPGAYDVRITVDAPDEGGMIRDARFAQRMTETEALDTFVQSRDDWADDRPELLRAGRALIEEVLR
jgi:exonuclease SbcD